ncbi:MAG: DASS family sodium-coupled anion symporter, partial [Verrucomicrobia bacterium]|nr:DASS family sodium-coupled anion symporter [Verrucomicrobiota bacterium]
MTEPTARLSAREEQFEHFRQRTGFVAAPLVFALLSCVPVSSDLTWQAQQLLAVLGLVITLWITEAIPLPVTALFGPALCVILGVAPAKDIFKNFADPIIFLFLGSFLLAEAMLRHGLNRRVAFLILGLRGVGESPARLLAAFGAVTGFLSMWISNTAATAMMFPIGVAILTEMARRQGERTGQSIHFTQLKYGTGLMLTAAFASSIGGLATPVGSPPNLITLALIRKNLGRDISFLEWMAFGAPLAVVLVVALVIYLNRVCPAEAGLLGDSGRWLRAEKAKLGRWTGGERNVLLAFAVTVALWLAPGVFLLALGDQHPTARWFAAHLPESVVALLGATLLFVLPTDWRRREFTLKWDDARRIDWGTILLFGGGLALGDMMVSTGLAKWIGEGLAQLLQAKTTFGLVALFTVVSIMLTETTSNTAAATMVVPVAIAVAQAAGADPLPPAIDACLGDSMAFMLPDSTPPNAIVYGSGCVPLLKMVKHGLVLDLVAAVV